ncbi:recombinase family protein [Bradyrhizobium sp. AUGA SZCCT0176]|uniref:recombinase family protein n=1 Tax=Bradyrhizobium sp. AUGA SZCCT0176 TaxID=2807664 RepID=UPI001BAD8D17|nr:recombinase family protein [Bradyrhizobium sp. AUGA SZCCT0176]MBR1223779.1 recombinase family protein [Bradyrhizobium sp. AUGA SZCCT0176]
MIRRISRPYSINDFADRLAPAAAYVRMSTDLQKYSTENQLEAIRRYADKRGLEICRIYEDAGRSGLTVGGRDGLQQLMKDVQSNVRDFNAILVYDVSRWGRFQDADEAAYYEHLCSRAGIRVHYCEEQFDNDGSIGSILLKSVKRVMAGEYSRELSVKVFAGQCRLVELGFRQGGTPGYGLRRELIDENHVSKGELQRGDRKSLQTDRVVLTLGPQDEVDRVRQIYGMFVDDGLSELQIASHFNDIGLLTDLARPWTRSTVHQILTNEKYIGNNVFNRVSFKLKQKRVVNSRETWVRAEGVYPSVVPQVLFERARTIIDARSNHYSDEQLLSMLQTTLEQEGYLSGIIIDERADMPSSSAYRHRFGSLIRAYQLIGYAPERDFRYIEINRRIRKTYPEVLSNIISGLKLAGGDVIRNEESQLLTVNGGFTVALVLARAFTTVSGSLRWRIRLDTGLLPDITVAVRLRATDCEPLDYYVFPSIDMALPRLKLAENNSLSLDAYRFETLDFLYSLAQQCSFGDAA